MPTIAVIDLEPPRSWVLQLFWRLFFGDPRPNSLTGQHACRVVDRRLWHGTRKIRCASSSQVLRKMQAAGKPGEHVCSIRGSNDPIIDRETSQVPGEQAAMELNADHLVLLAGSTWPYIRNAISVHQLGG